MLATIDLYGVAAIIASITGLVTAIGGAIAATVVHRTTQETNRKLTTANGETIGQIADKVGAVAEAAATVIPQAAEIARQVDTHGGATLGEMATAAEARHQDESDQQKAG